ncbi:hypothetical protein PQX77_015732 [Marasmius sp. AFHP31]|nr:hypothetical protein PQX77_015732 [Marasmius sp. AFHP31]
MPNIHTIEDHFCNLLYKLYKHWPYHEDYSAKLTDRSLIPRIPLDLKGTLARLAPSAVLPKPTHLHLLGQAPVYFYKDNLSGYIPLEAQNVINMVAEAITCVGFLGSHTVFIPGATHAWINSVVNCMDNPPPSKLEPKQLAFFQYNPLMPYWVTRPSYHHNPILHEEFYPDELNRPDSPSVWDYQHEDSKVDEYLGWDKVAVHNIWE